MAQKMDVSVSFVLTLPGGQVALTVPTQAELYDELTAGRTNSRCIRVSDIGDPVKMNADGTHALEQWVTDRVEKVLIYTHAPGSLALGDANNVGLTAELDGTWTKTITAIPADPIVPFTVEWLRKAGLV